MVTYEQIVKGLNMRPEVGFFGYSSIILVRDGEETILFDTGGPGVRGFLFNYIKKFKIDKIFISHLHLDHCCNIDLFPGTPIYLNKTELDGLLRKKNEIHNTLTYFIVSDFLKKNNFQLFDKEFQLTENIRAVLTYGHTCGHSSLKFNDGNKDVILAGDAIETYQEYLSEKIPEDCHDKDDYIRTKRFIKNNFSIVIPGHSSAIIEGKQPNDKFKLIHF
jgi:N-acyl homoserine lactone hydrolase